MIKRQSKIIFFTLVLCSCGKSLKDKSDITFFKVNEKSFSKYINPKSIPEQPNLSLDKTIYNNEYPIEIAIYENNKWYYNLPNLGDGKGEWRIEDGRIKLFAKRTLFNMYIDIISNDVDANSVKIQFTDRFGQQNLPMQNLNIHKDSN